MAPPICDQTFGAQHLAFWTFSAQTIGALDVWQQGQRPGNFPLRCLEVQDIWRSQKLSFARTFGSLTFGSQGYLAPQINYLNLISVA